VHSGDHDHRHIGKAFFGSFQQADAIELGHHQVREHQLELFSGLEQGQSLHPGSGLTAFIVSAGKHGRDNLADRLFVVDDQDAVSWHSALDEGQF
jgi:hypothetical protein